MKPKQYIKLSHWAKLNCYSYRGAFVLFQKGGIPGSKQLPSGAIVVEIDDESQYQQPAKPEYNVVYARVSSSENKSNLESQATRVSDFCTANGWIVHSVVKECASGLNDNRPKLLKILRDKKATRIIVEHKDRLTRFGFNYINVLLDNCEIVVINQVAKDQEDLMQDFVSLVTSFCARLYGTRRTKRNTEVLIKQLQSDAVKND